MKFTSPYSTEKSDSQSGKMRILVSDIIAPAGLDYLHRRAEVDYRHDLTQEELIEIIGQYQALLVRSRTKVTKEIIEAAKKLLVIGRAGTGVDNIDIAAATRRGIVVVNAPASSTITTAEHTIGLMLALARHIPQAQTSLKAKHWQRDKFLGVEMRGKVLGIIGLGRIGSQVAKRMIAMEMKVIACDPFIPLSRGENLGVRLSSLDELLKTADFISLHVPLTPSTRGMIGARELSLTKPGAYLINSARGGIVDEGALVNALNEGRLAGAALDVFAQEPPLDSPLLENGRVIVTPHLGASTREAQTNVSLDIATEIIDVLHGRPAPHAVNAPIILPETMKRLMPYLSLAQQMGRLHAQTLEGQLLSIKIAYRGEIAQFDTSPLRASLIRGLLEDISEEFINLVNADLIAKSRGLSIVEERTTSIDHYTSLIISEISTSAGRQTVAGTIMRDDPHIVRIDDYWVDFVPSGYLLLAENIQDQPGILGKVGTILGDAQINISFMQVGRAISKGSALMVLGVDEPVSPQICQKILEVPPLIDVKLVRM